MMILWSAGSACSSIINRKFLWILFTQLLSADSWARKARSRFSISGERRTIRKDRTMWMSAMP